MNHQKSFMAYALQLAQKGRGETHPNPMVGCVIVYQDTIIGQGWHQKAGTPHAEVHAIQSVKDKSLLKKSTLYVTLEPCRHHGKTPPCTSLILESEIPRVVVGCLDANPLVGGKGIQILKDAGCEVTQKVLEKECLELNAAFFTYHKKKRPYILLKWAQSQDGFIAPLAEQRQEESIFWLTSALAQQRVHQWRSEYAAILIGVQTLIDDNPQLTTRKWKGNTPQRCLIDPHHRAPKNAAIFQEGDPVFYFTKKKNHDLANTQQFVLPFIDPITEILEVLYHSKIISLIVEGGSSTLQHFLDQAYWEKIYKLEAPVILKNGIPAPDTQIQFTNKTNLGPDTLYSVSQSDSKA